MQSFARNLLAPLPVLLLLLCASVSAQESPKPPAISPHARLLAARSIYFEYSGGRLPYDVISDAFQGWGRFQQAADPAHADLIVSISAPIASDSGVSMGVGGGGGGGRHHRGGLQPGTSNSSSAGLGQIRLAILDAHDRVVLWSGSEQPKSSMKESKREDNEVDASLSLFRRFRDAIEPAPGP